MKLGMTDERKGMLLMVGLLLVLALCVVFLVATIEAGVDEYARCKADGGETEFCLIGDGS